MSELDDDLRVRDAVHRAYDSIPTPAGFAGRILGSLGSGARPRPRMTQWAVGAAVAAVLAAVVGAGTIHGRLG
ncbi:MAG: hypothetical protein ACREQ5_25345, partial [Candidatus Dormibacteria bacterium]